MSQFLIGPSLPIYRIEEIELIGGSMFLASASDKSNLIGQFESERNAKEACKREFVDKSDNPAAETAGWGLKHPLIFSVRESMPLSCSSLAIKKATLKF